MADETVTYINGRRISKAAFRAWRRSEAYMIPVTEEGYNASVRRLEEFSKGFESGIKAAASSLEHLHKEHKKEHRFFLKASEYIRNMIK